MHQALLTFNAGEVTPYLRHRIDFEKTNSSAEEMQNFLSMPYGGVIKRPGLRFLATTAATGKDSKLFAFVSSADIRYLIHFCGYVAGVHVGEISIYRASDCVEVARFTDAGTGPHPSYLWSNAAHPVREVQMQSLNDIAIFTHANLHPFRISRYADTDWRLDYLPFSNPPMGEDNRDEDCKLIVVGDPLPVQWQAGVVYKAGVVASHDGADYTCLRNHSSVANYYPLLGSATWSAGLVIALGVVVTYINGSVYTCITAHTAGSIGSSNTPVGTSKDTYWVAGRHWVARKTGAPEWLLAQPYKVGDMVIRSNVEYEAIADHVAATPNEPGVGKEFISTTNLKTGATSYWKYWDDFWKIKFYAKGDFVRVKALDGVGWLTGHLYAVAETVRIAGVKYTCIVGHTSGSTTTPGTGGAWATVWEVTDRVFDSFSPSNQYPGDYVELSVDRPSTDSQRDLYSKPINDGTFTDPIACSGSWEFFTYGVWGGTYVLQESADNGVTWKQLRIWRGSAYGGVADRAIAASGTVDECRLLRLGYELGSTDSSTNKGHGSLIADLPYVTGRVIGRAWVAADEIRAKVEKPLIAGVSTLWRKSAFTARLGFPKAVCMHETRLVFGSTVAKPVSLWLSAAGDFLNFTTGVLATDAVSVTLATTSQSPICWLASQRRLFIGTGLAEWVAGSETQDAPLTPLNFLVRQYGTAGSIPLQPTLIGPALVFAARAGARLTEMAYSLTADVYESADLSRLAEHLTHAGITSLAWQQTREPAMWAVRADGVLLHFAYSRAEKIAAWSRQTTQGGLFRDVVVFPAGDGDDEVFFIVERGGVSCLERFPQHWQKSIEDGTGPLPWFHVDGVAGTGAALGIPTHLRNNALTVVKVPVATPSVVPVVSTETFIGEVAALPEATHWQIGFPIVSRMSSLPIDTVAKDGTTQARRKRTHKLLLSLHRSRGGAVWNTQESRRQAIVNTQPAEILRTGWEEIIPDAGHLDDLQLHLSHSEPWPFCLRCAVMRWQLHEV